METKRLAERITKGKVIIATYPDHSVVYQNLDRKITGDIICEPPFGWEKSMENWQANAELIAEAFNITNQTGLSPKELLEQRDELRGMLERLRSWYEEEQHRLGEYTPVVFSQAKALLEKLN